ncbi:MAG: 3-phosphoshikimate 1-carboxyvinyltransferase [Thermodesulfobacteriota bacterium]
MIKPITISPLDHPIRGEITVPGDKSISHRAVMLGAIAEGDTVIRGFLNGADNLATIAALRAMGVDIAESFDGDKTVIVNGCGLRGLQKPTHVIDCANSGTTARLLTGLLSGQSFSSRITGDDSLKRRPMGRVVRPLTSMGARITGREETGSTAGKDSTFLPLHISPAVLRGISYDTPVASAQLKSAILLAGLYAGGETCVTEKAKSRDHTERMLRAMGVDIDVTGLSVTIKNGKPLNGIDINVPGDISSAAFFMVAALIVPGSELLIKDVGVNPTRRGIIDILKKMGGEITLQNERGEDLEPTADIFVRASELKGIDIDGKELLPAIDEFPVITIAAAFAEGITKISGAGELRVKESDRIAVIFNILDGLGLDCVQKIDGINIRGRKFGTLSAKGFPTHGDHRIAMSLAVAALGAEGPLAIDDASCVDVSFPGFFHTLHKLRGDKGK